MIEFPPSLKDALVGGISRIVGCVSVVVDQDLVSDDAAEAGHQAFNAEVKKALDAIIPTLGVGNAVPSPDDLAALGDRIAAKVREAILAEGNILEDLFAGIDPDDVIGFTVLQFGHAGLITDSQQDVSATFDALGRYDLTGTITATPI